MSEKTSPVEFVRQVKQEGKKVTWPTRKETIQTSIMVAIFVTVIAIYLAGVDAVIQWVIQAILSVG
ncbi:MAG: preprotein translocase subunit SecE [Alphaproteobacteria bacterium]